MRRIAAPLVLALCALLPATAGAASGGTNVGQGQAVQQQTPAQDVTPAPSPFDGNGMWIWQLPRTERGNWAAIVRRAKRNGVTVLYIKNADGPRNDWRQFTPQMVDYFHAAGLKVCGWHYVYGASPVAEARLSANAIADGADCFIIDAEVEYKGRYAAADLYMRTLRGLIGNETPVALAGFPYIHFHGTFPYSVFLRPGDGAQYNLPQMYWKAIGTTVDNVFATTYSWNSLYKRPIYPLGQIWMNPPASQVKRFRALAQAYGARGVSWWEWTQASGPAFAATGKPLTSVPKPRTAVRPTIGRGSRGDWVIWAQEHLLGAGQRVAVNGRYTAAMVAAVRVYQQDKGLPTTGILGPMTWEALLRETPVSTAWSGKGRARRASTPSAKAVPATAPPVAAAAAPPPPASASAAIRVEVSGIAE